MAPKVAEKKPAEKKPAEKKPAEEKKAEKAPAAKKPRAEKKLPSKDASSTDKKKKKSKKSVETYKIYIFKVLKQVHPDIGISSKAMGIMNSFINDIFEKLAAESSRLARYNKKPTITSREIQTAVRLVLPGELAKHAVSEDGSLPLPAVTTGVGAEAVSNPSYLKWLKWDRFVNSCFNATFSPPIAIAVLGCTTAVEVWSYLNTKFQNQFPARKSLLRNQLYNMRRGSKSVGDYLQEVKAITDSLAAINEPVSESDITMHVLQGLGKDYHDFVVAIQNPALDLASSVFFAKKTFNSGSITGSSSGASSNSYRSNTPYNFVDYDSMECQISATDWLPDSGASHHLTNDASLLTNTTTYDGSAQVMVEQVLAEGLKTNNLYPITSSTSQQPTTLLSVTAFSPVWHKRLGHPAHKIVQRDKHDSSQYNEDKTDETVTQHELVKRWDNHKVMVSKLCGYFNYLDRHCLRRRSPSSLKDVGFGCFREFFYEEVKVKVKDDVISLITKEREGGQIKECEGGEIDKLIKTVSENFLDIGGNEKNDVYLLFATWILSREKTRRNFGTWNYCQLLSVSN
ncbi:hypothetical protein C5167_029674 [Papaver somniferum]|nr:hypothetical protein C5167_029674 [Papaver somniferum]